jgi:crotonobetainyl-CoA:carnitine CoA-transferase CaiB-like acyl-CoA transferase
MFASNNVGKAGLCIDLKTDSGRRIAHELIRKADVLVENFRAGVTTRIGLDPDTVQGLNPDLIYLSLSSQGSTGPESAFSSYGCTLDLLSGLASATGYRGGGPMWSSAEVNYPDQIVALAGAALVAHAVATGARGQLLDISQRELVAWTLSDRLAAFVWEGKPMEPSGNRRPGAVPHDVYPTDTGTWVAIACFDDRHRRALAGLIPELPATETEQWWQRNQDDIDVTIARWTSTRSREHAVAELRAAGVPAVPVCSAADRAAQQHYRDRRVALRGPDTEWLKGFPLVLHGFTPPDPLPAPALGEDVRESDAETFIASLTESETKK